MERKIGEIFEYNGEWYQCLKGISCKECDFSSNSITCDIHGAITCTRKGRSDDTSVVFKKLEKVGEPYSIGTHIFQRYKVFIKPYIFNDPFFTVNTAIDDEFISIEVKQNKEDMEEKNQDIIEVHGKKYKFIPCEERGACSTLCAFKNLSQRDCWDIPCSAIERRDGLKGYFVELSLIENQAKNNMETSKLKPFDIQKAREGKPVYTRDGRKARIICFDKVDNTINKPIVALVTFSDGQEYFNTYYSNGKNGKSDTSIDLMMLPEKKEGWVNVYYNKSQDVYYFSAVYETKEEVLEHCLSGYVDTIKVEWEE